MPTLMKGHKWRDHKHKMTYPAWVEIKSDEIRCEVVIVMCDGKPVDAEFLSYAGKPLANMKDFADGFVELSKELGLTHFDCGFEVNGNFNDSYRWVRSTKKLPDDLVGKATRFILFDLPEYGEQPYETRMNYVRTVCLSAPDNLALVQPYGEWARCEEDVEPMFLAARKQGHEGLMVKSLSHRYEEGKRSYGWLKVKPEDDADGKITALIEAISEDGTPLGRTGSVTIAVEDGSEATPHGIPHELGTDMHNNPDKYIGQWAEFKFMERDRQGGYRHPVWGRLREAKA